MRRLKLLLAGISFLGVIMVPALAAADVNDFVVSEFQAEETLSKADPQGELRIIEHIDVNFSDFNHGILRAIPKSYKNHSLQLKINGVSSDSGAPTRYTTYASNGNTVLKIGDPNRTVTGPQEYTVDYTVNNVIGFYKDHDELYWDVNGDQWQQQFQKVSVSVNLPADLKLSQPPLCYTGIYGSATQDCLASTKGSTLVAGTTQPLGPYQTLTYVASFDKGYFHPSKWYETVAEYKKPIGGVLLPLIVLGGSGWLYWWRRGRDAKGRGVIVPQYDAPDGLKPIEVGALMDFKVDSSDITATIIDLAIRRYLKIIEEKKDKLLRKDTLNYKLQLINADFSSLDKNETMLLNRLFPEAAVGAEVDISAQKNKLYTLVGKLNKAVESQLKQADYFRSKSATPNGKNGLKFLAGLALIILSFILFGAYAWIGTISGAVIGSLFLAFLEARTAKGTAAKEHALGLKMYMETAEKDRLEKLQGPDAKYAANAAAPVKTVELFEKLLPYAMVLGVEKQWSKQFESLYLEPPDWYSGNWNTFNAYYLASSLNSGVGSAVNSAFSAPSSSGSSGSGGGGFSGGGGGGGGGGGW
jgi:uncharacterized membrane protein